MNEIIKNFETTLRQYKPNIVALLESRGISPDRFIETVQVAIKKTPKLLECDPRSLFGAILTSADLALPPNTPFGLSFIIPYGNEAQFQIGYQGWVEIAKRNPNILDIYSELVCENDEYIPSNDPFKPPIFNKAWGERGKRLGVFAVVIYKNGYCRSITINRYEIEQIKKFSKNTQRWEETTDPMGWFWRKTALKQLCKELEKTADIEKAYHIDTVVETGGHIQAEPEGKIEIIENKTIFQEVKNKEVSETATSSIVNKMEDKNVIQRGLEKFRQAIKEKKINEAKAELTSLGITEDKIMAQLKKLSISEYQDADDFLKKAPIKKIEFIIAQI